MLGGGLPGGGGCEKGIPRSPKQTSSPDIPAFLPAHAGLLGLFEHFLKKVCVRLLAPNRFLAPSVHNMNVASSFQRLCKFSKNTAKVPEYHNLMKYSLRGEIHRNSKQSIRGWGFSLSLSLLLSPFSSLSLSFRRQHCICRTRPIFDEAGPNFSSRVLSVTPPPTPRSHHTFQPPLPWPSCYHDGDTHALTLVWLSELVLEVWFAAFLLSSCRTKRACNNSFENKESCKTFNATKLL